MTSQAARSGAPAQSQARTSGTYQTTRPPIRTGAGSFPAAPYVRTVRTPHDSRRASPFAATASGASFRRRDNYRTGGACGGREQHATAQPVPVRVGAQAEGAEFHHNADGTITAHTCRFVGVGRDSAETLADLDRARRAEGPPG